MRDLEREIAGTDGVRKEVELLRSLTPGERLQRTFDLRRVVLDLARSGIRLQHPGFTDEEVERELQRRILPAELFEQLFPQ